MPHHHQLWICFSAVWKNRRVAWKHLKTVNWICFRLITWYGVRTIRNTSRKQVHTTCLVIYWFIDFCKKMIWNIATILYVNACSFYLNRKKKTIIQLNAKIQQNLILMWKTFSYVGDKEHYSSPVSTLFRRKKFLWTFWTFEVDFNYVHPADYIWYQTVTQ